MDERKVVVTTAHRGVFFGTLTENKAPKSLKLKDSKNCIYWDSSLKGFIGLANQGPSKDCRIGPAANIEIYDITSIVDCTKEAIEKWEAGVWS